MYDWELRKYLEDNNYILSSTQYLFVCKTCPQLNHIEYNPYKNNIRMWTPNSNFTITVQCERKQL